MIRLLIVGAAAIAGIRRVVGAEAERQGRSQAWWVVTAALFVVGAAAGMLGASILTVGSSGRLDPELLDATGFLGGLLGGVVVALPTWVYLRSLRAPGDEGPASDGSSPNWTRWSLILLAPLALGVILSPVMSLVSAEPEAQTFVTSGLPDGVDAAVVGDHILRRDFQGTIVVGEGQTLDCGGKKITARNSGVGVALSDGSTIRNCEIVGFNTAVSFRGSSGATADRITATNNRVGFWLFDGAQGATIKNSHSLQNEIGYLFEPDVTGSSIENNVAEDNWGAGFQVGGTTGSFFAGNEVIGGGSGFWITDSHDNTFAHNSVTGASDWFSIGVERGSSRNTFTENEVSGGGVGIAVFAGAKFNTFRGNDLHHNVKGAHADGTAGMENVFVDNRAHENRDVGLWDDGRQPGERFRGNECFGNGDVDSVPVGLC